MRAIRRTLLGIAARVPTRSLSVSILEVSGAVLVVVGVLKVYEPAGYVLAGVVLVGMALVIEGRKGGT